MTGTRNLRRTKPWVYLLLFGALLAGGCSTGGDSGLNLVTPSGSHPAGFLSTHPATAISDSAQCAPCHGSDLAGGIAKTSCFTAACHHGTISNWALPAQHGASAKGAPGSSGFASCQICHGSDFSGGGSGVDCFQCHTVDAPHPRATWRAAGGLTHITTDTANASVCVACHFPGSTNNPAGHPATPAPAGTPPGCYNNTLCHGAVSTHVLGPTWTDPTSSAFHGITAKQNLVACQTCHGTPGTILFNGGTAATRCTTCHTTAKAHPTTWYQAPVVTFPGYVQSHRNSSNQSTTCSICHDYTQGRTAPDPAAPSCFSASYSNAEHGSVGCHSGGPGVSHAVPYFDNVHFQTAFTGACDGCHAVSGASPNPAAPLCTECHTLGSPLALTGCASCHANPPAGSAYPNIEGAHVEHLALNGAGTPVTCNTCHNGLGTNTLNHYNRANGRAGAGGRVPPGDAAFLTTHNAESGASSFSSAAFTCSNVSCHGGQANLNWRTGNLTVNTQCTSCHASGTAQYNSYNSGKHQKHVVDKGIACTTCHDTDRLAPGHFTNLATATVFEQAPSATLSTALQYNGTSCNPQAGGLSGCHGSKNW